MAECVGKKPYPTEDAARRAIVGLWVIQGDVDLNDMDVYPCPYGRHFHVGHKSKFEVKQQTYSPTERRVLEQVERLVARLCKRSIPNPR